MNTKRVAIATGIGGISAFCSPKNVQFSLGRAARAAAGARHEAQHGHGDRAERARDAAKFALQAREPGFGPPEHFAKMQRDEYAELGALIKGIGMKAQ